MKQYRYKVIHYIFSNQTILETNCLRDAESLCAITPQTKVVELIDSNGDSDYREIMTHG